MALKTNHTVDRATRAEKWKNVSEICDALLDERRLHISHITLEASAINNADDFMVFLLVSSGMGQENYDLMREIVNGLGGQIVILDKHDDPDHTFRIWPR